MARPSLEPSFVLLLNRDMRAEMLNKLCLAGNLYSCRPSGLLVRNCMAPGRAHLRDREPGQNLPRLGLAQPVDLPRGPSGQHRCDPVRPLLIWREVPGVLGASRLCARVQCRRRLQEAAGDRLLRWGVWDHAQPRRRVSVRRGVRPRLRQLAAVQDETCVRLSWLVRVSEELNIWCCLCEALAVGRC